MRLIFIIIFALNFSHLAYCNNPCTAISINNNAVFYSIYDLSTQSSSGIAPPSCGTYNNPDMWFSFVAPPGGSSTIEVLGLTMTDPAMAIYTGNCSNPTEISCWEDQSCGENPNPGATLTGLTPGTTYYIRIWSEDGVLGTFRMRITNPNANNFSNYGSAISLGSNCVQLTTETTGQNGCSWFNLTLDFSQPFDIEFSLNFGFNDSGADGICLVLSPTRTCGTSGAGMGAQGIPNSFIVEFDTYHNGVVVNDIPEDHIAYSYNGIINNPVVGPAILNGGVNIEDGTSHNARFVWDPATMTFTTYFDGTLALTASGLDIINDCFSGATNIFWGFTAATGALTNYQTFCYESAVIDNTSPLNEEFDILICENESYTSPSGTTYNVEGTYTEDFIGSNGCAAVRTINLETEPIPVRDIQAIICQGDTYTIYGQDISVPGDYVLQSPGEPCDTVVNLHLGVLDYQLNLSKSGDVDCDNEFIILTADVNILGADDPNIIFDYFWFTSDGEIFNGQGTNEVTVKGPGTYSVNLVTTLGILTCNAALSSIDVEDLRLPVTGTIIQAQPLDCINDETTLFFDNPSSNNLVYHWTTNNGNILTDPYQYSIDINQPGNYQLIAINPVNGCRDTFYYSVIKEGISVQVSIDGDTLTCSNNVINLTATLSNNPGGTHLWTTSDGNIISDSTQLTIMVDESGTYTFTFTSDSDCSVSYSYFVAADTISPNALSGADLTLNCDVQGLTLYGSYSNVSSPFATFWESIDGTILSTNDSLMVNIPGLYVFKVINNNGCTTYDTLEVFSSSNAPQAIADPVDTIRCDGINPKLSATISSSTTNLIYKWSTQNGTISGLLSDPSVNAIDTGTYFLEIIDTVSKCKTLLSFKVTGSRILPQANAGLDLVIDCETLTKVVTGVIEGPQPNYPYNAWWSSPNGTINPGPGNYDITVDRPGTYIFHITNLLNGCRSTDTMIVVENADKPIITFSGILELTCSLDTFQLTPTVQNAGINPKFLWTTLDGNIFNGNSNVGAWIDQPGTYTFTVTNQENTCFSTINLLVTENKIKPTGNIPNVADLTCVVNQVTLVFNPTQLGNYTYQWTTSNGNILTDPTLVSINVNSSGLYELMVTNEDNGCTELFTVQVNQKNAVPNVNAGQDLFIDCKNSSVQLNTTVLNSNDYTFQWFELNGGQLNNPNTQSPIATQPGTFIIEVVDQSSGCKDIDTIIVENRVTNPQFEGLEVIPIDCISQTGSISFESITNVGSSYDIYLNGVIVNNSPLVFDNLSAGTYHFEVIDNNGCKNQIDEMLEGVTFVSYDIPDTVWINEGESYHIIPNFLADTTGFYYNSWIGSSDISCLHCIDPVASPITTSTLSWTIFSPSGCSYKDEIVFVVREKLGDIFVPNVFSPLEFDGINDRFTVFAIPEDYPEIVEMKIFNRWGAQVFSNGSFPPNEEKYGWDGRFKGVFVNPGVFVYFVRVKNKYGETILLKGDVTVL